MSCRADLVTPVARLTTHLSRAAFLAVSLAVFLAVSLAVSLAATSAGTLAGLGIPGALAQAPVQSPARSPAWLAARDAPWMTEDAMRAAFIGKTLDGHYGNGLTFTETYFAGGQLEYREAERQAKGRWHFRGHVFCTFYDPSARGAKLNGGCWTAVKTSANCYEFYLAGLAPEPPFEDETRDMADRWSARGWRSEEASTCNEKPSV